LLKFQRGKNILTISKFIFKYLYNFYKIFLTIYNMNFARTIRAGQNPKLFYAFQLETTACAPDARLSLPSLKRGKWLPMPTLKLC
jgi:hypothetical protein